MLDKANNTVVIGADSAGINVDNLDVTIRKDEKVFRNKDFVIGCTSSFRMIQLLKYSFNPPKVKGDRDIFEYMCTVFIDEVKRCFKNGGFLQKYEAGDERGGVFLVAYEDRLFKIEGDFQVAEADRGYDACGSGAPYALGSLYSSKNVDVEQVVLESLESASFFNAGVSAPYTYYRTKKK